ncbi:MAG: LruC domain-containing protein [Prolixibacteraceae bacterium]|nr:LruC domain-containing protein [Prolixibacteraceae bacterium]
MKKLVILIFVFGFWGCLQNRIDNLPKPIDDETFDVEVPADFTWSGIIRDQLNVSIKFNGTKSVVLDSTTLELYDAENNLLDVLAIYDGEADFELNLPSEATIVKVKSPATGQEQEYAVDAGSVDFNLTGVSALAISKIDSDKDGVYDAFDQCPFNSEKLVAIGNTTGLKSATKAGSNSTYTIFEDLWPSQGDYDFNDLVIKTEVSWDRIKKNYVGNIEGTVKIESIGAGLGLGLGFELFESSGSKLKYLNDVIESISGSAKLDEKVTNGIILVNKVQDVGNAELKYTIKTYEKSFKNFVLIPYLFWTDDPTHQIRTYGTPPTEHQKMSLFHTGDDTSPVSWKWGKGVEFKYPLSGEEAFYRTKENYPWGIEFITKTFKPSKERRSILKSYPRFRTWAESGGKKEKNWYDHPE